MRILHNHHRNVIVKPLQHQWNRMLATRYCINTKTTRHSSSLQSKSKSQSATKTETETPVVIIGGGPTGLCLSILLSQYNIPSTLIESRTPSQIHSHPQAHYLNLRTMEIIRHYMSPNVYKDVMEDMPPVKHWEGFTFSHCIMGRQIARVVHPVRRIGVGQDGNGVLVDQNQNQNQGEMLLDLDDGDNGSNDNDEEIDDNDEENYIHDRISICNPGHLAQNQFASILLKEAKRASHAISQSQIIHGQNVTTISENSKSKSQSKLKLKSSSSTPFPLQVQTSSGMKINTKFVIAADGSSSSTRNTNDNGNGMSGNPSMQHLINVHFRTSTKLSNKLQHIQETIGMLHFVFHEHLVGAFVCHNLEKGDWVLQIPFFPPFQDWRHYDEDLVRSIVLSGLGISRNTNSNNNSNSSDDDMNDVNDMDVDILSIKPWTMAATVAPSYFIGQSNRIILAGDAAHAFPPAGGFGMNTGIQDAHNLAWRLAGLLGKEEATCTHDNERGAENTPKGSSASTDPHGFLKKYELERRPIASQNAALSVRNYNRTLDIAKACYLNADHPVLLKTLMGSPPMNLIPLKARQTLFDTSVKTAMMPLSNLGYSGNLFSDRITTNIRKILSSGGGLPLLFPRYEIGFSYDYSTSNSCLDETDDTAGFVPSIKVGFRLPHIPVKIVSSDVIDGDSSCTSEQVSLTDIESQLNMRWDSPKLPRYSLIIFHKDGDEHHQHFDYTVSNICKDLVSKKLKGEFDLPISIIEVYSNLQLAMLKSKLYEEEERRNQHHTVLLDMRKNQSAQQQSQPVELIDADESYAIFVRPDGHVEKILDDVDSIKDLYK